MKKIVLLASVVGMMIVSCLGMHVRSVQAAGTSISAPILVFYTTNYGAGLHGSISGATAQTIAKGSNASTVTAVPNVGYGFTGWSDGVMTASRTDTNVQGNINVTASFSAGVTPGSITTGTLNQNSLTSYTLTYTAGAHGGLQGSTTQSVLFGGSATTVKAIPNIGYKFSQWSDGVMTASRTDTNITANKSVMAYFALLPVVVNNLAPSYTVTYVAGSHGDIQGTTVQSIISGNDATTVKAIPDSGYKFKYWSDGVTTASRTDTNITGDLDMIASFGPISSGGGSSSGGTSSQTTSQILGSGVCPLNLTITQNLKSGAHDGEYLKYNGGIVTQVYILQKQINRILAASYNQAAGPVDGRFGPLTKLGVQRLQLALVDILDADLGPKGADGIVGAFTRAAMNNSCGGM